jgi:hypothetical protein
MSQLLKRTFGACFGLISRVGATVRAIIVSLNVYNKMNCMNHHAVHLPQTIRLGRMLNGLWKVPVKLLNTLLFISALLLSFDVLAVTPPGTVISNTATSSFDISGTSSTAHSNAVNVTTTIIQTPSSVEFYQYDMTASSAFTPTVVTQHASSGPPGAGFLVSADSTCCWWGAGRIDSDGSAAIKRCNFI